MRTIFFARGPAFKRNHETQWIRLVDEYQIFLYALGIKGEPHNGTWERVTDMFVEKELENRMAATKTGKDEKRILEEGKIVSKKESKKYIGQEMLSGNHLENRIKGKKKDNAEEMNLEKKPQNKIDSDVYVRVRIRLDRVESEPVNISMAAEGGKILKVERIRQRKKNVLVSSRVESQNGTNETFDENKRNPGTTVNKQLMNPKSRRVQVKTLIYIYNSILYKTYII